MRLRLRSVLAIAAVVVVAAGAVWLVALRPDGSAPPDRASSGGGGAPLTTAAPATSSTTTSTTTTTTMPAGLALPLQPPPVRIAWAGDSVAGSLVDAIAAEANARGVQLVRRTMPGCGMVRGVIADEAQAPIEFTRGCDAAIPAYHAGTGASGADVVTWLSTWETANRIVDGRGYEFGTPEGDAVLLGLIDESVQQLTAGGARLVFLTMPPNTTGPERPTIDPVADQRALHLDELLRTYARAHADRVAVLDLAAIVCPTGPPCPTEVEGVTLRPEDGGHFGGDGPAWVAPRILDRLLG